MIYPTIFQAVVTLGAEKDITAVHGNSYEGIKWINEPTFTEEEVENELQRLITVYHRNSYKQLRAQEYPDFKDYLDGIVKGDAEQIQAYIDACLAVKEKYPKPS
jgi:hypothetical protein